MKLKSLPKVLFSLPAAAMLVACSANPQQDAEYTNAAPAYSDLALEMQSSDTTPPSSTAVGTASSSSALMVQGGTDASASQTQASGGAVTNDPCHPHLFARTHEVIERLNGLTNQSLEHVGDVIKSHPKLQKGQQRVWESVKNGVDRRFTMDKSDAGTFDYKLELELVASGSGADAGTGSGFVTVFTGTTVVKAGTGSTAVDGGTVATTEISGTASYDFTALRSIYPNEPTTGQFAVAYDVLRGGDRKKEETITFTNFLLTQSDPHGPRNGTYVYFARPGIGGSLKFQDSLVLLCPANPSSLVADVDVVAEWYRAADGNLHGRADGLGTGGQIVAGDKWEGVACHSAANVTNDGSSESYWMMKEEDANGNTVQGQDRSRQSTSFTGADCDPAFVNGNSVVPLLTGPANDFDFASIFNADGTMKDMNPFLFPKIQ